MSFDVEQYVKLANKTLASRNPRIGGLLHSGLIKNGSIATNILSSSSLGLAGIIDKKANDFFGSGDAKLAERNNDKAEPASDVVQTKQDQSTTVGLVFPPDLENYYMKLQFSRYDRPVPYLKAKPQSEIFVTLPLPRQLTQGHQVAYDTPQLGLVGTITDSIQSASQGGDVNGEGVAASAVASAAPSAARMVFGSLASAIAGDAATVGAEQLTGAILNPNISVAFRGPTLREYEYSWEFAPENPKESETIKNIITEIRKRALPSMTFANATGVLSYPQLVQISAKPEIMDFKRSMIRAVNVHYSPNGIPSFFKGTKQPTFISLQLSFVEVEYFLSEDFGGTTGTGLNSNLEDIGTAIISGLGLQI